MNCNNFLLYATVVFGSVLILLFTLYAVSVSVSAQDAPDYLLGNLTLDSDLSPEQIQAIGDKIANYTGTMMKEANGNMTKMNILLIEDLEKRNLIDEDAKEDFLSFAASLPTRNLTTSGNDTDILKDLNTSSALLDEISKNNSDSQRVILMTDILSKRITDIGNVVSGNVTNIEVPTTTFMSEGDWSYLGAVFGCGLIGMALYGGIGYAVGVETCGPIM